MGISNIRLLNQQLVNPQMSDIHELVAWMGMLQAQEYTMMRWAAGIRLKRPSMSSFRKAFDSGRTCSDVLGSWSQLRICAGC